MPNRVARALRYLQTIAAATKPLLADLGDAIRHVRNVALIISMWMGVKMTLWITSVPPTELGGVNALGVWTGTATLIGAIAALAGRTPKPGKPDDRRQ